MSKQLPIIISAIDQATGTTTKIGRGLVDMGEQAEKGAKKASEAVDGLHSRLGKLKEAALEGFGIGVGFELAKHGFEELLHLAREGPLGEIAEEIEKVGKASRKLGLDTETVSSIRHIAVVAGGDWHALADAIGTAEKNLSKFVETGTGRAKPAIEFLSQHGTPIRLTDSVGQLRSMQELLPDIADKFKNLTAEQRQFVAGGIFGDSSIIGLLRKGGDRISQGIQEANRFNVLFTKEQTHEAEEYRDAIRSVGEAWFGVKATIETEIAPFLAHFYGTIADGIAEIPRTVKGLAQFGKIALFDGGESGEKARQTLLTIGEDVVHLITVGAEEAGSLFAHAAVSVLKTGVGVIGAALAGSIGDKVQDVTGITPSTRTQLSRVNESIANTKKIIEQQRLAILTPADSSQGIGLGGGLADRYRGLRPGDEEIGKNEEILKRLEEQRIQLQETRKEEIRAERAAWEELLRDRLAEQYSEQVEEAGGRLESAWSKVREDVRLIQTLGAGEVGRPRELFDSQQEKKVEAFRLGIERLREGLGSLGSEATKVGAAIEKAIPQRLAAFQGLEAQRLTASGDTRGAERLRLLIQQREELDKLRKSGAVFGLDDDLHDLQKLQLERFDVDTKATESLKALGNAEERYQEGLKRRADLVQSGTIDEYQATQQNLVAADAVRKLGAETIATLNAMEQEYPELAKVIEEYRDRAVKALQEVGDASRVKPQTFGEGALAGFRDYVNEARESGQQGRTAVLNTTDAFVNDLTPAIVDSINHLDKAGEAAKRFGQTFATELETIAVRLLIIRAIGGIGSAVLGGSDVGPGVEYAGQVGPLRPDGTFAKGGRPRVGYASLVGEKGPELFIPDRPGTIVPNAALAAAVRGGGGGGASVVIGGAQITVVNNGDREQTLNDTRAALAEYSRSLLNTLADQLESNAGGRQRVRSKLGGR